MRGYSGNLGGKRILAVETRCKAMLIHFADAQSAQKLAAVGAAHRIRLADAAFDLTHHAYRTRGITNDPQRAAELKAQGPTRPIEKRQASAPG